MTVGDGSNPNQLIALLQALQVQNDLIRERLQASQARNEILIEQVRALTTQIDALTDQIAVLQAENARLRGGGGPAAPARQVPAWVKSDRPPREPQERKKRSDSFVRKRDLPTEVCIHVVDRCPDCNRVLKGGWVHNRRQVIDIPFLPVQITEHLMVRRECGYCRTRHLPQVDLSNEVIGQHRIGIRLMSLIAYLHTVGRMTIRRVRLLLMEQYGIQLSIGEIVLTLQTVARCGQPDYEKLRDEVRRSPFVHADETGWREDGQNGYLWSFSTPAVRYFEYNKSRAHDVCERALGEEFRSILVSDFYAGYNFYLGLHQRCWVHFLRALHEVKEKHPDNSRLANWIDRIRKLYDEAKAFLGANRKERVAARRRFQRDLERLAKPYLKSSAPQRVLAERIERFSPEMFTFVEHPGVPSENNAAERAIRPCVIARKVSGGTRSGKGSQTKTVLLSLFGTWQAQGADLLATCMNMLTDSQPPVATAAS